MPKVYEGKLSSAGLRVGVVCGRFNGFIVQSLLAGAIDAVVRTGGRDEDISVYWCPGAYEIPQLLRQVAARGGHDALVCLGAVIRGSTPHFDYVAGEVAKGVSQVAAQVDVPITFGVLTTDTIEQAIERAGTKAGNKGFDAAMAAIEMASLFRALRGQPA
jgi:6,7-dimethyl-8-ribityllumazine synthase